MPSIEGAIRAMLIKGSTLSTGTNGVPDSRVTHGYRLQDSALPAVTYSVDSTVSASLAEDIYQSTVTINAIASTSSGAIGTRALVISCLKSGTYDTSIKIDAIIVTDETVQPETVGIGDEQEPSVASVTANVYWRP